MPKPSSEPMGAVIRRIREARGITQAELSRKLGVAKSTISRLETDTKDTVTLQTLKDVARALEVPLSVLLREYAGEEPVFHSMQVEGSYSSIPRILRAMFGPTNEYYLTRMDDDGRELTRLLGVIVHEYFRAKSAKGKGDAGVFF
ncbi:MAG: helix-turn-helix domain-containing protein [Betaproteobacteria bacterium]